MIVTVTGYGNESENKNTRAKKKWKENTLFLIGPLFVVWYAQCVWFSDRIAILLLYEIYAEINGKFTNWIEIFFRC